MADGQQRGKHGAGVDSHGGPVFDPTQNVLDLVEAANKRQDDLRAVTKELYDIRALHQSEMAAMRERHQRELDQAESDRLDAIRQVDREDVSKTAAQALNAIQTLQAQSNITAETLRGQVQSSAQALATQLTTITGEINKRLSALELSWSEGKGKQTVADPQLAELAAEMRSLTRSRNESTGKSEGISWVGALIMGGIALIGGLIGIAVYLANVLKP
jgi:hypothetical protein